MPKQYPHMNRTTAVVLEISKVPLVVDDPDLPLLIAPPQPRTDPAPLLAAPLALCAAASLATLLASSSSRSDRRGITTTGPTSSSSDSSSDESASAAAFINAADAH